MTLPCSCLWQLMPLLMAWGLSFHNSTLMGRSAPLPLATRTLTPSEKNYPQIEREALALLFGVKRFHQYLYGCKFCLITDHKPLTAILAADKAIPSLAAARLQRWAILLSAYQYDIQFRRTQDHANADGLSFASQCRFHQAMKYCSACIT